MSTLAFLTIRGQRLEQQLSKLVAKLTNLRDSSPVDDTVVGVVLEPHRPGNDSTYPRLRAPKRKTLVNGKRTMSLKPSDVEEWEQKIYARNQQTQVAQCLALIQQAAEIAGAITWNFDEVEQLVNKSQKSTRYKRNLLNPAQLYNPSSPSSMSLRMQRARQR